jgi:hypothetical protein
LAVEFAGVAWERLRNVAVDREGEHVHALRPKLNSIMHRLLCEVKLVDNVKVVTLRSTVQVQNLTLINAEMVVVDSAGKKQSPVFHIRAYSDYELAGRREIVCQPPAARRLSPSRQRTPRPYASGRLVRLLSHHVRMTVDDSLQRALALRGRMPSSAGGT